MGLQLAFVDNFQHDSVIVTRTVVWATWRGGSTATRAAVSFFRLAETVPADQAEIGAPNTTIERTRGIMREYPAAACASAATLKESREALIPSERTARCGYFIFA